MGRKGEITVFLALILISICALLCGIAESVRTAGARCYLRMAVDSSMDSLMAQYHRELWEQYRILGLESDGREMLEEEFVQFAEPYIEAENWYPMEIRQAQVKDMVTLTEGDGRYFEQEILDYMKYGLIGVLWDELDEEGAGGLMADLQEGEGVSRISDLYDDHAKDAVKLEKALERIQEALSGQKEHWERGREALDCLDGGEFIRECRQVIKELKKLPGLVEKYERQADKLDKALKESRSRFKAEDGLREGVRSALEDEISQYEAYTDQEGQRRREASALKAGSQDNIQFVEQCIEAAEEVMDYIDNWDPEDEEDELDEEALWSPVQAQWEGYPMLWLPVEFGIEDKEKEQFLEQVGELAGKGLLELVLPEGTVVSGRRLKLKGAPSAEYGGSGRETPYSSESGVQGVGNFLDRLIVCEYGTRYFNGFQKELPSDAFYELEYILCGKEVDRENLSGVVTRLTALRTGLNLAGILSDTGKRQEARSLAMAIVGGTGMLPLVSIMTFFIMSQWALGEALMDVRCLLEGEKVPLWKSEGDWKLDLQGLLDLGKSRSLDHTGGSKVENQKGIDYTGYMRMLLFAGYGREEVYRMMDVVQLNIGKAQPGFAVKNCACLVDMEAAACGKHVFFSLGLWKDPAPDSGWSYETAMAVSGSYFEKQ